MDQFDPRQEAVFIPTSTARREALGSRNKIQWTTALDRDIQSADAYSKQRTKSIRVRQLMAIELVAGGKHGGKRMDKEKLYAKFSQTYCK